MKQIQSYTYTLLAGASVQIPAPNDNFIIVASTGPVTVRGDTFGTMPSLVAGQGLKSVAFSRLELKNELGAPNTVTLLMSPAEFVNQVFSGSVQITGGEVSTVPPLTETAWSQGGAVAAVTPLTIFTPAQNPNGAIVWSAEACDATASPTIVQTFLAKNAPPTGVGDGDVVVQSLFSQSATAQIANISMPNARRVAPGLGLYFISSTAGGSAWFRSCRYTLL
ncbi:hypothetical protein Q5W_09705 [Hydrogenophaga sp. PBC]|uniref:hypothetical protein n=1 Tax=Hydrogenophaga sp. PBC TaxID=795665 RepID=UPI0002607733|nr:hypothetical protein [Hydrogenophaga sp. PBC]AOS79218.1 hypothetical protein Q5W_09705 [Hydrogenophaga sp. PBC]